jgi:hypothetical protein
MRAITDDAVGAAADSESAASDAVTLRPRPDRRDAKTRTLLVQRVASEFCENPGLCLTVKQGSRLFGLPEDVCARIFVGLVNDGTMHCAGHYYGRWRDDFVGRGFVTDITQRNFR